MLSLLAALLLSGPLPARADEPAPAIDASADTNGDGVISGKERRQKRRADRRARRGTKAGMTDAELDAADAAESSERGGAAANKASSAAASLKSSLPSADDVPGSAPAANPSAGRPAASSIPKASNDPGKPSAPSDYALAARSGYAPAFAAAGLKLAPDGKSVVRLDGKPATPEDYARLQREIAAMPAALGRRPDFFSVVSPAHYADLKQDYKARSGAGPVYKDVAVTADERDFVHSASCDKLSGECNKSAESASYKKGDYVAPEDLDNMWDALQKELDASAQTGEPASPRSRAARGTAVGAAIALSPSASDDAASPGSSSREERAAGSTPASAAAASARSFLKRAFRAVVPGADGAAGAGSRPSLALGALLLAALSGALFLRRKG